MANGDRWDFLVNWEQSVKDKRTPIIDQKGWSVIDKVLIACPNPNTCVNEMYEFMRWLAEAEVPCTNKSKEFFEERTENDIYDMEFYNEICNQSWVSPLKTENASI